MFLFDLLPVETGAALTVAAFFFVVMAIGIGTILMLRKTIKMALRMIIVAAIILIAIVGSVSLWLFIKPAPRSFDRVLPPARPPVKSNR
ncbi:MAG: hypothetical protein ACR2LT_05330 [Pyrinomonadaceae bacterium]